MTGKTPKELLANHELVGFVRPLQGRSQTVRRASSAKVGKPSGVRPKQLLANHELVGFVRPMQGRSQTVRRASSAKVTKPPEPARDAPSAKSSPEISDD